MENGVIHNFRIISGSFAGMKLKYELIYTFLLLLFMLPFS